MSTIKPMHEGTMLVLTTNGHTHYIARADYENAALTQLPIYTRSGLRLRDHHERMGWPINGRPMTVHRGNIREVIS